MCLGFVDDKLRTTNDEVHALKYNGSETLSQYISPLLYDEASFSMCSVKLRHFYGPLL